MRLPARGRVLIAATIVALTLGACTPSGSTPTRSTSPSTRPPASPSTLATGSRGGTPAPNYRAELAARPLHLPVLRPGERCPVSNSTRLHTHAFDGVVTVEGAGPVRPFGERNGVIDLTDHTQHRGWMAAKTLWISQPRYQGPFLIRIRRLDGRGPAGLLETPTLTSAYTPHGPTINSEDGYRGVTGATWMKRPGCIAWQVDGLGFSHVIVVRAVCSRPGCTQPQRHGEASRGGTGR